MPGLDAADLQVLRELDEMRSAAARVYLLTGAASEIGQAASAAVRGPGRDPYARS